MHQMSRVQGWITCAAVQYATVRESSFAARGSYLGVHGLCDTEHGAVRAWVV